ncbi:pyrroloquinoline quinone biosynthesis peptide chaperone PqqD [Fulvimarina sp. 2208YS6-2-32]|uniref:Pyrroloquinoline quinone biosynthesis peptide chaperone PqqD n=1 Tax=Fulvimarina uroteuthidis TaxID=3098149 RepID=A0ABU5HX78_9HYPH|nr:pyrroloquinoline quinone biosynthesis peptide chaperone PqqD [Fulvimarina sp. 2208YS6-2-32]MDY8107747.1 pyrroloquinoline quinone biosynthesis peptide chaperone PqqD [Fulvimarina sp. 2208YS6-2-32]
MSEIADATVPKLPHGVRFREDRARGGYILVGPERIYNIDGVSVEILKRVDGTTSLSGIVADLARVFTAEEAVIRPDVEAFLTDLRDKQMVTL